MKGRVLATAAVALLAACTAAPSPSTPALARPTPSAAAPTPTPTAPAGTPTGSEAPTPIPPGPDVPLAGLSDSSHGWAVTGGRLLVTVDGGATWRDATPPGGFATADTDRLLGVAFADALHGWVAVNGAFTSATDPSYGRVDVWRTGDGGRSWSRSRLPPAQFHPFGEIMADVQFDFLDIRRGFAFLSGNGAKGRNDSDLFWTADGGATWSADRPTGTGNVGNEGSVAFATPSDGVIVDAYHGSGVVATRDGGETWADATLSPPSRTPSPELFMARPEFTGGSSGLMTVDVQADNASAVWVYGTSDLGASWEPLSRVPAGFSDVAFLDAREWLSVDGPEVATTVDAGRTWTRAPSTGLPGPASLSMADAHHGWALAHMSVCLEFKSDCSSRTGLYATADGGSTWTQLLPG